MSKTLDVLIVDDSRIFARLVQKALMDEKEVNIVGTAENGAKAIEFIKTRGHPDLVTLDVEMPVMNGLETLAEIQKINREKSGKPIGVIMISSLTARGSDITIKALEGGAYDFICKPDSKDQQENFDRLKNQLVSKIRCFQIPAFASRKIAHTPATRLKNSKIDLIIMASSTGGPRALLAILPELCEKTSVPIILVQHMPPKFTASLAVSLNDKCKHTAKEAEADELVKPDMIYVAPGGRHLTLVKKPGGRILVALNDLPPENHCRPSADVIFRSAALQFGAGVVGVILTGMGTDGAKGVSPLQRAGAYVIAQDEESSVVWGMAGTAVASGRVHKVLPLEQIAGEILEKCC